MNLTNLEKETIILFNEAELTAEIEVHNPRLKRRLAELRKSRPDDVTLNRQDEYADFYTIPKSWIKINPTRVLTEQQMEQRKAQAAKMRSMRE